jgi:hypothetical protein
MTATALRVRRATQDDLGVLRPLWESMRFSVADLERRFTEFQVAENAAGQLVGAVGFQMTSGQGRIHSEAFTDFSLADTARPLFWDRLHTLAVNHGITRLWTQENAPFWNRSGLHAADAEELQKLPAEWNEFTLPWFTLKLKSEEAFASLEKELDLMIRTEKQRTARVLEHAKTLKNIATVIAVILALFVLVAGFFLLRNNPGLLTPGGR